MNFYKHLCMRIVTLCGIGYIPYAPGTWASLIGLIFAQQLTTLSVYWILFTYCTLYIVASFCIDSVLNLFKQPDPSCIVIDEFIGCLITFFAIPHSTYTMIAGFLLFRFFDISKCCLINKIEELPGSKGILLDDIAAGAFSNLLLQLMVRVI